MHHMCRVCVPRKFVAAQRLLQVEVDIGCTRRMDASLEGKIKICGQISDTEYGKTSLNLFIQDSAVEIRIFRHSLQCVHGL